jgi:hypothetical protein
MKAMLKDIVVHTIFGSIVWNLWFHTPFKLAERWLRTNEPREKACFLQSFVGLEFK